MRRIKRNYGKDDETTSKSAMNNGNSGKRKGEECGETVIWNYERDDVTMTKWAMNTGNTGKTTGEECGERESGTE